MNCNLVKSYCIQQSKDHEACSITTVMEQAINHIKHIQTQTQKQTHTHTHARTNTHTYIQKYITRTHNCVTKTVECGKIHKYTNIHNFLLKKHYEHFTK